MAINLQQVNQLAFRVQPVITHTHSHINDPLYIYILAVDHEKPGGQVRIPSMTVRQIVPFAMANQESPAEVVGFFALRMTTGPGQHFTTHPLMVNISSYHKSCNYFVLSD